MNIITRVKNENFTVISNFFLKDKSLSIKAKGFLAVVMGLPDDWEFSISGICSILKEGKTAVYNTIDELKQCGYCKVTTCRDERGRIVGNDYAFYEQPYNDMPHTENPYTEKPNMDNQPQLNTDIDKALKEVNKESIAKDADTFADEMYNLYPTKCPKRNKYLGKSHKDKAKIKALLKLYSMEEIEKVLRYEVETKFGISYMKDFGTFLNNFPDPSQIEFTPTDNDTETDKTFFNGVEYR